MGKSVAAELLEERVLWDETPLGVPCLHSYLILLKIHSFFFSLAGNLQTAYTKIKDVTCSSQLDYTWKVKLIKNSQALVVLFLAPNFRLLEGNSFHSRKQLHIVWRRDLCKMFQVVRFAALDFSNLLHQECCNNCTGRISTVLDLQRHPVVSYCGQLAHYSSMNDEGSAHNFICKLNVSC